MLVQMTTLDCSYAYDCGLRKDKCREEVCDFMIGIQRFYIRLAKELNNDDYIIKKEEP